MTYNLPSCKAREDLDDLNAIDELRKFLGQLCLVGNDNRKQVTRWASKYAKCTSKDRELYTEFELKDFITKVIISDIKAIDGMYKYITLEMPPKWYFTLHISSIPLLY